MREFNACNIMNGEKKVLVNPDFYKMFNQRVEKGDIVIVPLIKRDNELAIWECGGRRRKTNNSKVATSSFATLVASDKDFILNAIIFDKFGRRPNNRHALINIREGYHLYTGKMSIKKGALAPSITIFKMVYRGDDASYNENFEQSEKYYLGKFEVVEIFTEYTAIEGLIPAERLVSKLYTYDVVRPFYANGWNISNQPLVPENVQPIQNNIQRLISIEDEPLENNPNKYIDKVEDEIVSLGNKKLSAVFHYINFEEEIMRIIILKGLDMKDVKGTIDTTEAHKSFKIGLNEIQGCYNHNIIFRSNDMKMLEVTLNHDDDYSTKIGPREHIMLRAWRG